MKKIILSLLAILGLSVSGHAAVLGSYNFTSGVGPSTSVPTLTFSDVTRVNVTAATAVNGGFTSTAWSSANAIDTTEYVQFTFVTSGQASSGFSLESISFKHFVSGVSGGQSGPINGQIRVTIGSSTFTQAFTPSTSSQTTTLTFAGGQSVNQNQQVTVRFYGWNGGPSGQGSLTLDDIQVDGVAPVPEPINVALALFGLTFVGVGVGRKMLKKKA